VPQLMGAPLTAGHAWPGPPAGMAVALNHSLSNLAKDSGSAISTSDGMQILSEHLWLLAMHGLGHLWEQQQLFSIYSLSSIPVWLVVRQRICNEFFRYDADHRSTSGSWAAVHGWPGSPARMAVDFHH